MTMDAALGYALAPARLGAGVVASFAFLALLLASVGLYGVIAYGVSQSVREIGIRIALGGRPADVLKLIVRQGMVLTAIGFGIGIPAAMALTRLMSGLLYGVSPMDPFAYVGAAAILGLSAFLAAFLPAWRATKVQPLVALRDI
jgi:ABC-type antimicrobial peptide transport system permease subunit